MKHTINSAREALRAYVLTGSMTEGGSFSDYDCDGIRVATFKVDGGLIDEYGSRFAGVKKQYPDQDASRKLSRRHLSKYCR